MAGKFRIVEYTDGNGYTKPALVIGTRKSVQKGQTVVPRPDRGNKNLLVFSPKDGHTYVRTNIPQADEPGQPRTWVEIQTGSQDENSFDTELVGAGF